MYAIHLANPAGINIELTNLRGLVVYRVYSLEELVLRRGKTLGDALLIVEDDHPEAKKLSKLDHRDAIFITRANTRSDVLKKIAEATDIVRCNGHFQIQGVTRKLSFDEYKRLRNQMLMENLQNGDRGSTLALNSLQSAYIMNALAEYFVMKDRESMSAPADPSDLTG